MMQIKLFEVRDRATLIPCFGIRMAPGAATPGEVSLDIDQFEAEKYLLQRAGFGFEYPLVFFGRLEGGECRYDPFQWDCSSRTVPEAHRYVAAHWEELTSGDVIDVEYILGEKDTTKVSERFR
jgi:hypothetical protein